MNESDIDSFGPRQKLMYDLTKNDVVRQMSESQADMLIRAFSDVAPAGNFFSVLCSKMMEKAPDYSFPSISHSVLPDLIKLILSDDEQREYQLLAKHHQYTENSSLNELRTFMSLAFYAVMVGKTKAMNGFISIDFAAEYRDSSPYKKAAMFEYIDADVDLPFSWWWGLRDGHTGET